MKKFISLFLAFVLILSLSSLAFADDLPNYKWVQVESNVQQAFGSDGGTVWPIEEVNASIWLPAAYYSIDPADEDFGEDCIGLYITPDGSDFILINYTAAENMTLDSYYTYCIQQGLDVSKILINDIPALMQDDPANNCFFVTFLTQENNLLQFVFSPLDGNAPYGIIMCSIRPTNVEEASAEAAAAAPVNPVSGLISK